MNTDFDVAICGGGPVGLALALLLVKHGTHAERIALIDAKQVDQATRDPRAIALSYGSRQILADIGAWTGLTHATDAIHHIHVSRRGHFGRTLIEREDYDVPALGYVTRYGKLVTALADALSHVPVAMLRPKQVALHEETDDGVSLQFTDGSCIRTHIMVQAEGGLFSEQAEKAMHRDYGQSAVVAHVHVSAPIAHRAFERFTEEGPLALLPQEDGYALVWCTRHDSATRLAGLSDAEFLAALQDAFGSRLGTFISASPRHMFALGLNAHPVTSARTVAIGNAAQTLHPVAGQGFNLGLRDAVVLARLLSQEAAPAMLDRFALGRKSDRSLTIRLTDTMARIFSSAPDGTPSQTMLGLSLGLIDLFKPGKRVLAEQMMFGWR